MSASVAFSQAKTNLYLTEGSCSVTHWHYKVTIKFFTGANCTGNYDFCYFISDDDY